MRRRVGPRLHRGRRVSEKHHQHLRTASRPTPHRDSSECPPGSRRLPRVSRDHGQGAVAAAAGGLQPPEIRDSPNRAGALTMAKRASRGSAGAVTQAPHSRDGGRLGVITRGSLVEGLEMKLEPERNVEDMKAGKFVIIEGDKNDFFSMVTDMRLDSTGLEVLLHPPERREGLLREVLSGTATYNIVALRPMLMMPQGVGGNGQGEEDGPRPVKAIPSHFSRVVEAHEEDVSRIFGREDDGQRRYFSIGNPLDMETPVCIDMLRFAERSNGIFGKTGTGKSFLTRLALCGLIHYDRAVNLIFDMHNEYGFKAMKETAGANTTFVKGLKQLFGERVAIFSLDPKSTRARGIQPDFEVYISYDQIAVEDIAPLQDELKLNPTAVESAYLVYAIYKERW
ncbi:MAG TPA: DUF87 domain-containing protein [Candidatus Latescibacteria bacterium]|nr:DUF87 domain-containing protein [Candidatus Latescibacterota bacterium]